MNARAIMRHGPHHGPEIHQHGNVIAVDVRRKIGAVQFNGGLPNKDFLHAPQVGRSGNLAAGG